MTPSANQTVPHGTDTSWKSPTVGVILGSTLMAIMGISLISPTLPTMRQALGITETQASLVISVFTLPPVVLAPFLGAIADRFGRRLVLIPCLLVYGAAGAAISFTSDFTLVLILRFIQGCGVSGLINLSLVLIGDFYEGTQQNILMGWNQSALSVGAMSYPIIGGLLAGLAWNAPYFMYLISIGIGLVAIRLLQEPRYRSTSMGLGYLRAAIDVVLSRDVLLLYSAVFLLFGLLFGGIHTALPLLLSDAYGMSADQLGLLISLKALLTAIVAFRNYWFVARFSDETLIASGFLVLGIGLLSIRFVSFPVLLAVSVALFGAGQGLLMPSVDAKMSHSAPEQVRGSIMSLRITAKKLGQTIGPTLFVVSGTTVSYPVIFFTAGSAVALTATVVLAWMTIDSLSG